MKIEELSKNATIGLDMYKFQLVTSKFKSISQLINYLVTLCDEKEISGLSDLNIGNSIDFQYHYVSKILAKIENKGGFFELEFFKDKIKENEIKKLSTDVGIGFSKTDDGFIFQDLEQIDLKRLIRPFRGKITNSRLKMMSNSKDTLKNSFKSTEYLLLEDSIVLYTCNKLIYLMVKDTKFMLGYKKGSKNSIFITLFNESLYHKFDDTVFEKSIVFSRWNMRFPYKFDLKHFYESIGINPKLVQKFYRDEYDGNKFHIKNSSIILISPAFVTKKEAKHIIEDYLRHINIRVIPELSVKK